MENGGQFVMIISLALRLMLHVLNEAMSGLAAMGVLQL